ncbi:MAG: NYN domain-containing protein [Proteobacteria bacterium]|nr:NYN domain-containing protein [Pseudomonadota bacterium]
MEERVAIFIDGSNFYHTLKELFGRASVNFSKLSVKLTAERKLIRTYYYNSPINKETDSIKYSNQQRFFENLKRIPYFQICLGRLEKRTNYFDFKGEKLQHNYFIEKGVDVHIATDILHYAYLNSYDTAILISGDGDFVDAVMAVKSLGKHVENAFPKRFYHLPPACDKFIHLDDKFLSDCWM